jgi:hydroxymethylpyrimidine pyrophosphatase-like HAD family hydrolase
VSCYFSRLYGKHGVIVMKKTAAFFLCLVLAFSPSAFPVDRAGQVAVHLADFSGIAVDMRDPLTVGFLSAKRNTGSAAYYARLFAEALRARPQDLWVNLSSDEPQRVAGSSIAGSEFGRELLAQDLMLKKKTDALLHPDSDTGRQYWQKVAPSTPSVAGRVWIVPSKAELYFDGTKLVVLCAHFEVKAQLDAAEEKAAGSAFREEIMPALQRTIDDDPVFAPLRRLYAILLAASWYKKEVMGNLPSDVSFDRVVYRDDAPPELGLIHGVYRSIYEKGSFDLTEKVKSVSGRLEKRRYFSGGADLMSSSALVYTPQTVPAAARQDIEALQSVSVRFAASSLSNDYRGERARIMEKYKISEEDDLSFAEQIVDLVRTLSNQGEVPKVAGVNLMSYCRRGTIEDLGLLLNFIRRYSVIKDAQSLMQILEWKKNLMNGEMPLSGISRQNAEKLYGAVFDQDAYLHKLDEVGDKLNIAVIRSGDAFRDETQVFKLNKNIDVSIIPVLNASDMAWARDIRFSEIAFAPAISKSLVDLEKGANSPERKFLSIRIKGSEQPSATSFISMLNNFVLVLENGAYGNQLTKNLSLEMSKALALTKEFKKVDDRKEFTRYLRAFLGRIEMRIKDGMPPPELYDIAMRNVIIAGAMFYFEAQGAADPWQSAIDRLSRILAVDSIGHDTVVLSQQSLDASADHHFSENVKTALQQADAVVYASEVTPPDLGDFINGVKRSGGVVIDALPLKGKVQIVCLDRDLSTEDGAQAFIDEVDEMQHFAPAREKESGSKLHYILAANTSSIEDEKVRGYVMERTKDGGENVLPMLRIGKSSDMMYGISGVDSVAQSVISLTLINQAGFAVTEDGTLALADRDRSGGDIRKAGMGMFRRDTSVSDVRDYVVRHYGEIVSRGAFAFDVDNTLLPKGSKSLTEFERMANIIMRLLRDGVRVAIISGNAEKEQFRRVFKGIKTAMSDDLAPLANLTFYVNGGATKIAFDAKGDEVRDEQYNEINGMSVDQLQGPFMASIQRVFADHAGFTSDEWEAFDNELKRMMDETKKDESDFLNYRFNDGRETVEWLTSDESDQRLRFADKPLVFPFVQKRGFTPKDDGTSFVGSVTLMRVPQFKLNGKTIDLRDRLIDELYAQMRAAGIDTSKYNIRKGGKSSIDVTSTDADKRLALADFMKTHSLDADKVFYFGDEFEHDAQKGTSGNDAMLASDARLKGVHFLCVDVNRTPDAIVPGAVLIGKGGPQALQEFFKKVYWDLDPVVLSDEYGKPISTSASAVTDEVGGVDLSSAVTFVGGDISQIDKELLREYRGSDVISNPIVVR